MKSKEAMQDHCGNLYKIVQDVLRMSYGNRQLTETRMRVKKIRYDERNRDRSSKRT